MLRNFNLFKKEARTEAVPLYFFNTLGREKQVFTMPAQTQTVRMYNCGPTVYDTAHIGNLRSYVFADLIHRVLEYNGYAVKQVINITDFGHLSSDTDNGNDKMTKGLKREGMAITLENMRILAEKYTQEFIDDLKRLNIDTDRITFPRASDFIPAQIAMIQTLEEKAYAYRGKDGVYFDTARFPNYGKLGDIDIEGLKEGARVHISEDKRSPTDFLLWKADKKMGWESPWGKGFPGWHIECSAMINSTLGKQIDIHTGGIDLIPTHHNNEIAQSESATGKRPFSRFWMHNEFLNLKEKMSKSLGNIIDLNTVVEKGFHPLAYRYFLLGASYRTPLNFTWESLEASQKAYSRLIAARRSMTDSSTLAPAEYKAKFVERINDDLDMSGALSIVWELLKDSDVADSAKLGFLLEADRVLGLGLEYPDAAALTLAELETKTYLQESEISAELADIIARRDAARMEKNWIEADALRDELDTLGFGVDDSDNGSHLYKK